VRTSRPTSVRAPVVPQCLLSVIVLPATGYIVMSGVSNHKALCIMGVIASSMTLANIRTCHTQRCTALVSQQASSKLSF
jgi:hypothetical protein